MMKIAKIGLRLFIGFCLVVLLISAMPINTLMSTADAIEFAGGSGTMSDPYLIENKEQLNNIRNDLGAHYQLIANVEFNDADFSADGDFYNNGKGWIPLGNTISNLFTGTFDGNGFAIIGLIAKVSNFNGNASGFFGNSNGTIMNVALVNGSITDTSTGNVYTGGIVGYNMGTISNCYSAMTVSTMTYGGGIAGKNNGLITNCYNTGDIIKAQNYGTISGGIVGYNFPNATVSSCYNAGNVTANKQGGIAGENNGILTDCYFLESEVNGCASGVEAGYRCTINEFQTAATFKEFNFDTVWTFENTPAYSFPTLKDVPHIATERVENHEDFSGGIGNLLNPYIISDVNQLANVQQFPDACFVLANDIVFTDDAASNWNSIGDASAFTGYFDGAGYAIKGLTKCLFDCNFGTIKNTMLQNTVVTDAATIALINYGIISNCSSSSEIVFTSKEKLYVGGLVSKNYGDIRNCIYSGKISSKTTYLSGYTGGIAALNNGGTISSCYNIAVISTNQSMDGVVGENSNGIISDTYYYASFALGCASTENGGVPATVEQLKTKDFFIGFDFDTEWQLDDTCAYPAPTLKIMKATPDVAPENTTDFAGGNGTLFSPYRISNVQHLANLSNFAKSYNHFNIVADIVLDQTFEKNMIPSFNGLLDGDMHAISDFTLTSDTVNNGYVGFIGTNTGIIKNLKFKDCTVAFSNLKSTYIGTAIGYNNGIVSNLGVETNMTHHNLTAHESYIGGAIGGTGANSVIESVQTIGLIEITSETKLYKTEVGGIIGHGSGKIRQSVNATDIIVNSYVGPVEIFNSDFGGIIGYSSSSTKQNVQNQGNIQIFAENVSNAFIINIGGIAGTENAGSTTLANNIGNISVKMITGQYNPQVCIGGIVGKDFVSSATITESYNTGSIQASMERDSVSMGGIVGSHAYLVEDCYNTGAIIGTKLNGVKGPFNAGGIVGHGGPNKFCVIKRCYNIGEVSAQKSGGIIGNRYGTSIENCYYTNETGVGNDSESGTYPLSVQQLTDATNISSFDFNGVWTIDGNAQYRFPTLRNVSHVYTEHTCANTTDHTTFNELQHWKYCVFCGKSINRQEHSYDCICDKICNGCEYVREIKDVTNKKWEYDEYMHWQSCMECHTKLESDSHSYIDDESLVCRICNTSRTVTSVSVTNLPTKLQYTIGEDLDLSGLTVVAYYNNDTSGTVNCYTVSGYSSATVGEKTITVSFEGKTTTFSIDVLCKPSHQSDSGTITKKATCKETGIKLYKCTLCDEVVETETLPKLAHSYASGIVTKKATCKETGVMTFICENCGDTKTTTIAKLTIHTYSNNCDKSCNVCGKTRTVGKHKYSNSCDATCNYCNTKRTIKHTFTNACDTTCNVCKTTRTITHSYKTITTKATLSKNGSIIKKCTVCGKVASNTTIKYAKTFTLSATSYTYNGYVKTPKVVVKSASGKTLQKGIDYSVVYASGRKNVGTYKITVKMKGKYTGSKTLTFKINPPKTTISKLTAGTKSITAELTKKSTQTTGYQIQYSTSKTFSKAITKTISSYKTTKYTLKNLKVKKTYYVRVRTFKTVGKTKYYSGWSTYKYAKTK